MTHYNLLNSQLRAVAIDLGLCKEWQLNWDRNMSKDELIDMYKRGIDFSIMHDYPTNEYILANFDLERLNNAKIFINQTVFNLLDMNGEWVINGSCTGTLTFSHYDAATLYVRGDSKIKVVATGKCKLFIYKYDNADVEIDATPGVKYVMRKRHKKQG